MVELVKLCADHAETETYEKELEEKRKQEEQAAMAGKTENLVTFNYIIQGLRLMNLVCLFL